MFINNKYINYEQYISSSKNYNDYEVTDRLKVEITIEGKTAVIKGVRKLYGANVKATDLRGGAALVIAGIAAKGNTRIENIEYILRGYDKFDQKLRNLGVDIKIVNESRI